ncbi:MAG: hypothetical protein IT384_13480 [Deltaproteobacteria bacterium]|nr:hypothetical protein [Deltaproteobacteria bacterium]
MAEKTTSQAQQDPFAGVFSGGAFRTMFEEQIKRIDGFYQDLANAEVKSAEQAKMAIDESAKLMKQTVEYSLKLSAEWRKLALETTRRAAEMMQPKA